MRLARLALTLPLALAACSDGGPPTPPSIVLIVVDTLRGDHADPTTGLARTTALDALAADGVRFTQAFSHVPMTLPSHASLLSGRLPFAAGVKLNAQAVPEELQLLPDWLRRFGYRSAGVVSLSSLWPVSPGTGIDRGFGQYVYDGEVDCWPADRVEAELEPVLERLQAQGGPFFLLAHYSDPHDPYNAHGSVQRWVDVRLDGAPLERMLASEFAFRHGPVELSPGEHLLELVSEHEFLVRLLEPRGPEGPLPHAWQQGRQREGLTAASITITNPAGEPVSCDLWLWLQDVLDEQQNRTRYRLEVEFADGQVGRLLDALRRRGLYESSLVVFTSDHGEALGEHGVTGHVVNLYDEMLHVPLVMKLPAGDPRRSELEAERERLVRLSDLGPTLLDLVGLPPLPGQQGVSLLAPGRPPPLLAETHPPSAPAELYALRDERFKLVYHVRAQRFEMYDLSSDPLELETCSRGAGRSSRAGSATSGAWPSCRPRRAPPSRSWTPRRPAGCRPWDTRSRTPPSRGGAGTRSMNASRSPSSTAWMLPVSHARCGGP